MLLSDEEIDILIMGARHDNPHWEVDAYGLFGIVAKAQLKKVVEWGDEFCGEHKQAHMSFHPKRKSCIYCWQQLLKEIE